MTAAVGEKHHLEPGHWFHHAGAMRFCMDYLQTVPWLTAMGEKFLGGNLPPFVVEFVVDVLTENFSKGGEIC